VTHSADDIESALERMLDGDDEGFRRVYRSVQPGLVRYLGVLVGRDDAEDVASETWAQASRDLHRFSGGLGGFRGWITRIARNRAIDHLRASGRRPSATMAPEDLPEVVTTYDAGDGALESLGTSHAVALIARLPRDQAEAVMLRAVMGLAAKSAGEVLGKRAGAVRTSAHRGLKQLAGWLEEDPGNTFGTRAAERLR
jgi:RNA polymerase sigma-70 factor (ECF subfamily)